MNTLAQLALLTLSLNGAPARMPVNPAEVLQQPFAPLAQALAQNWGPPLPETDQGGRRQFWLQEWFGLSAVKTGYLLVEDDRLQSITLVTDSCEAIEAALRHDLGQPYKAGPSPQYLFSLRFARWNIAGIEFVLEDFAPGCEVAILLYQPAGA